MKSKSFEQFWTIIGRSAVSCAFCCLAVGINARAENLDIRAEGAFCQSTAAKSMAPDPLITPTWSSTPASMTSDRRFSEIDHIAHDLNAIYLRNMAGSLYIRLAAAQAAGLPLAPYSEGLRRVVDFCDKSDRSGQNFSKATRALAVIPEEVTADFAAFQLQPVSPEVYMRRLIVAALEAHRVRTLLAAFEGQTLSDPSAAKQHQDLIKSYLRRLLRLQHHYRALVLSGVLGGGPDFEVAVDAFMNKKRGWGLQPLLQSDPQVEALLGLNPAGAEPAQLLAPAWAKDTNALRMAEANHHALYTSILDGSRPIPQALVRRIRKVLDMSVRETLSSAHLKCQNTSPCAALSIQPSLAANMISASPNSDSLGRQACLCKIGAQHEWIDGRLNLALGFATAGAVIGAAVTPAGWFTYFAYGLATVDSLAAGAGVDDAYINVGRSDGIALLRAGGAVDPIVELDTISDYRYQSLNVVYNVVTGLIGITPPGRIMGRSANVSTLAKLEFSKAFTGAPAPDLMVGDYSTSYDPRENSSPIPFEMRMSYPKLAENFDRAFARLAKTDTDSKQRLFGTLKAAARDMATSNNSNVLAMLNRGVILREYIPKMTATINH